MPHSWSLPRCITGASSAKVILLWYLIANFSPYSFYCIAAFFLRHHRTCSDDLMRLALRANATWNKSEYDDVSTTKKARSSRPRLFISSMSYTARCAAACAARSASRLAAKDASREPRCSLKILSKYAGRDCDCDCAGCKGASA